MRKVKKNPNKGEVERMGEKLYQDILKSMGIGEDAIDPSDPDFWAKHDKARHGGHFDPKTQTCKLREKYEQGEKIENLRDEMDDIDVGDATEEEGGEREQGNRGKITPEEDAAYMEAVERGDMETAQRMVREVAARAMPNTKVVDENGEPLVVYHGGTFTEDGKYIPDTSGEGMHFGSEDAALDRVNQDLVGTLEKGKDGLWHWVYDDGHEDGTPTKTAIEKKREMAEKYHPNSIKKYFLAINEIKGTREDAGEDWFDIVKQAKDVGDDGIRYINDYENKGSISYIAFSPSQIKSADPVTYDDEGNVIPLSRRFDDGDDIRGDVNWRKKQEFEEKLAAKLPELDAKHVLEHLAKFRSDEEKENEFRRILSSGQIAEDSLNEVLPATVDAAYGICEDGTVDMAAHNRRYHPNGVTENTHCKYLDRGDITGNSQNNEGNAQGHKSSIREISYAEAERWFRESGNVTVFHATTDEDLEFMGLTNFAKSKMKKGTPLSKNQFENAVKEFCIVCRDLKKRFPRFQFGFDAIYPYDTSSQSNGGMATTDRRKGFGYIIIGDRATIKDSLGIDDDRAYHFILRHEIGHSLSSDYISHRFDEVFSPSKLGEERISQISRVFKTVCHIGDFWFGEKDEEVRQAAKEEIIADVFAFYTDSGYKKGMMPKEIEEFCEEMIENPHLKSQSEMLAMDSVLHAEKIEAPDYIEGFLEIKALHNPPKDTKKPYALNFIEDKWEYFDTEEERKEFVDNQRRLRQKTSQEDARAWMEQELPKIVAHIMGKGKNTTNPSGRGRRKRLNDEAADAIESAFGIGEDALNPSDPDFWAKHDKARHGGHFDPETMTCKLREKYEQGEKIENLQDEMDNIDVGDAPEEEGGEREQGNRGKVTPEEDAAYMEAVKRGDMETAERMVREAAASNGYDMFGLHGTKSEFTVFDKKQIGSSNDAGWLGRGFYFWDKSNRTYAEQYANGGKVMEVMLSMKEPYLIDKAEMERLIDAAERHDIKTLEDFSNEVKDNGYDSVIDGDGQMLVFEPNQIKSADPVTYDDEGNVIPLSRRFDDGDDIRGDVNWRKKQEFEEKLAAKLPGMDTRQILEHLAKFDSDEEKAKEFRRILSSGQITEQSNDSSDRAERPRSSVVKIAMGQDSVDDRMVEFRDLIAKKFPDKDATAIISELGKISSAEEQEAYLRRILKGN